MRALPDEIRTLTLPSGSVEIDEHGYLTDPRTWTRDFALHVAVEENLDLTDLHWDVIEFIRDWNDQHAVMPDIRFVMKHLAVRFTLDKAASRQRLFDLFPYGYVKQACRMAGMKQPRAWSTG
jgi:TusE/DsrC/DsvC family sulfur relay protein